MKKRIASAALALTFALPAQAHELEVPSWTVQDWLNQWAASQIDTLDAESLGDWRWMRDRYFPPPPQNRPVRRVVAQDTPHPAPVTQPAYSPGVEQWRHLVAWFWPAEHVDRMLRIMACESGGNPYAYNPSGATGLFQVMPFWQRTWPGDYTDPWTNGAVAYQIWLSQGYGAWVCRG